MTIPSNEAYEHKVDLLTNLLPDAFAQEEGIMSILEEDKYFGSFQFFDFLSFCGFDMQGLIPQACQVLSVGQHELGVRRDT